MITIREARPGDASGIAGVHVETWRTAYRGIVPSSVLDELSTEQRERYWERVMSDPTSQQIVYVATDNTEGIVGFASGGPEREGRHEYTGELYAIYLLQKFQRRGIGQRLTRAVVVQLIQLGFPSMLVWVLAENPSRRFYESLAGLPVGSKPIEIGGTDLEEVAYGWDDLAQLADQLGAT